MHLLKKYIKYNYKIALHGKGAGKHMQGDDLKYKLNQQFTNL